MVRLARRTPARAAAAAALLIAVLALLAASAAPAGAGRKKDSPGKGKPVASESPSPSPEPAEQTAVTDDCRLAVSGSVLFREDFERACLGDSWAEGSTHGGWNVVFNGYGTVTRTEGRVVLEPNAATSPDVTHGGLVVTTDSFGDADVTADVTTLSQLRTGSAPNAWEMGWLAFRYTDNTHFYYLVVKPNGWELGKADPAYPGAQRFLATGETPAVAPGETVRMRVRAVGSTIEVWAGTTLLTSYTDAERPYLGGRVGLYTEDAQVAFDEITVSAP